MTPESALAHAALIVAQTTLVTALLAPGAYVFGRATVRWIMGR